MMKNYFKLLLITLLFHATSSAQEVITLSGYDGSPISVSASSTVNETITIVFEDVDIMTSTKCVSTAWKALRRRSSWA